MVVRTLVVFVLVADFARVGAQLREAVFDADDFAMLGGSSRGEESEESENDRLHIWLRDLAMFFRKFFRKV